MQYNIPQNNYDFSTSNFCSKWKHDALHSNSSLFLHLSSHVTPSWQNSWFYRGKTDRMGLKSLNNRHWMLCKTNKTLFNKTLTVCNCTEGHGNAECQSHRQSKVGLTQVTISRGWAKETICHLLVIHRVKWRHRVYGQDTVAILWV